MAGNAVALLVACGNGGPTARPSSRTAWTARHGNAIVALHTDLDAARTTLSSLQRSDILGACTQLRDSLGQAEKGLPVPDPPTDAALRAVFAAIGGGTEDCIRGAQGPNIPQLEKSFAELRQADTLLAMADHALDAWP